MKTIAKGILLAICITIYGCATNMSQEQLQSWDDARLVNAIVFIGKSSPAMRQELLRRGLITQWELELVEKQHVRIGMSELALIMSWGSGRVNESVGPWGVHKQYAYKGLRPYSYDYVYVENGVVTSFQQ